MKGRLYFILHPSAFILPLDSPPTPSVILDLNKRASIFIRRGRPPEIPTDLFHVRARVRARVLKTPMTATSRTGDGRRQSARDQGRVLLASDDPRVAAFAPALEEAGFTVAGVEGGARAL